MRRRDFFRLAAALPPLWLLPQLPLFAAADGAVLKPVAPRGAPAGADRRLAQLLAQHKGQPVVINFWATWCEPCREEMPSLARLATRWQARGLVVLTVAVADNAKRVDDFLWETLPEKQALPVLHDREQTISRAWDARVLPTSVVLDRRHRVVLRGTGAIDWDAPVIDRQITRLIN
ncbi:MAG: TlpA family protein disulfide reductase [Rhodocyclales bacterium]|nr:TlpA family protein disulfide reductase [Rhodocyclales bacterium]